MTIQPGLFTVDNAVYLSELNACRKLFLPAEPGAAFRKRDLSAIQKRLENSTLSKTDLQTIWRGLAMEYKTPFD